MLLQQKEGERKKSDSRHHLPFRWCFCSELNLGDNAAPAWRKITISRGVGLAMHWIGVGGGCDAVVGGVGAGAEVSVG